MERELLDGFFFLFANLQHVTLKPLTLKQVVDFALSKQPRLLYPEEVI